MVYVFSFSNPLLPRNGVNRLIKVNDRSYFYFQTVNRLLWQSPVGNLLITDRAALWDVK